MKPRTRETKTIDLVDKLLIYQVCMDHEQSIRTSYQSLLTTLELGIFSLVFVLIQFNLTDRLWILATGGITLCLFFGIACEFRGRNVDIWKTHIVKLVEGTDLENTFKEGKYWMFPSKIKFFGRFRGYWGHWFEEILVPLMIILWLYILWSFYSPSIIRLFGIIAICVYVCYHFINIEWESQWD